ncbi:hypothetical protein CEUSTIGMA_g1663.t1 [Chlamydomonas eustigma]|uniref:Uncharacterized protein n=1 Tax=Chlamydomonas eustigma TaxID=1157962 RepID=A0A250WTS1_9CHLO|nr:hypothetical protein CEUSTIGMA_g1663.t1 [Chlamydomonas eustigma]|eukprot:GAX74214.1 hypothetical protein CEUSTIGMA_g1663.t1 [Chlamydomonas eustigma]
MVYAVDISPIPLAHAQYNAELAGVSSHIRFALGSWDVPLRAAGLQGQLGGLLSNPPYIPRAQMSCLQQEVQSHEPRLALDGGDGPGLDALQVICKAAVDLLAQGGLIALEVCSANEPNDVSSMGGPGQNFNQSW